MSSPDPRRAEAARRANAAKRLPPLPTGHRDPLEGGLPAASIPRRPSYPYRAAAPYRRGYRP